VHGLIEYGPDGTLGLLDLGDRLPLWRGLDGVKTAVVDAMDVASARAHADEVVRRAGSIDVSFNAVSVRAKQNQPLTEMTLEHFLLPVVDAATTHFVTATTGGRTFDLLPSGETGSIGRMGRALFR
jgi:uncharacterized lipoprotein NlpE involved in copper resistance